MGNITLIGHRGASDEAPENTLAAFRLAWKTGADGVEGDFRLSKDGEIVCMHDATTTRTTGIRLPVAGSTLARLRELDAGRWKGEHWCGERIPTLREVIATVPHGKKLLVELKIGPEILLPLATTLAESAIQPEQVTILAFREDVIAEARQVLPHIKSLWNTEYKRRSSGWTPDIGVVLQTLERVGATGLASEAHRSIDATFVTALREAGREFHVWTVNDPRSAARFLALGADSIITNRPGGLRRDLENFIDDC